MIRYVIKRLLWMIPVLLGVTLLVFILVSLAPTDPAALALGVSATDEQREEWREARGLNEPFLVQFGKYCYNVFLRFDFGKSYYTNRSIGEELMQRLPKTVLLAMLALVIGQCIGVPIGIYSAVKQYTWQDNFVMVLAMIGISMPAFWSGIMFSLLFALKLNWLPPSGFYGPKYWILPALTLSLAGIANAARMTRSCMLDVIRQDYIVTARAKGVSEGKVIWKHAFKNSLVSILTQTGIGACVMIGGAMVVESVFSVPGVGTYMINGIKNMDYPAVLGSVLVVAIAVSIILLIVDLAYALVDPRIRAQYSIKKVRVKEAKA